MKSKDDVLNAISKIKSTTSKYPISILINKSWADKHLLNNNTDNTITQSQTILLGIPVYWDDNIESYKFIYGKQGALEWEKKISRLGGRGWKNIIQDKS